MRKCHTSSHQRIYGHRLVLGQYGIRIVGRSQRLTLNYRTTAENLHFALGVLEGGSYADLEDAPEETGRYHSSRRGPAPRVVAYAKLSQELDAAAELIRGWADAAVQEGRGAETVAILVRDQYQRDRVVSGLGERGVDVRPVDREAVKPGPPVAMTMHRAKGTEFSKVLLFGMSEKSIPKTVRGASQRIDKVTLAILAGAASGRRVGKVIGSCQDRSTTYHQTTHGNPPDFSAQTPQTESPGQSPRLAHISTTKTNSVRCPAHQMGCQGARREVASEDSARNLWLPEQSHASW